MINRKDFGRLFAERYNITYESADKLCRQMFELLGDLLCVDKEDVTITGFGSFKHKQTKESSVRHPKTGEMLVKPARDFVKFTPSELLTKQD